MGIRGKCEGYGVESSLGEMDLVVIGNLLIDEIPESSIVEPGGAALYTALAAARLGARVGLHSVVGQDYPLQHLMEAGVALSLHRLEGPGGRTVITYAPEGRRLSHLGPGHDKMTPQQEHPFQTKLVILAPMPWKWQLFHLDRCRPGTAFLDPYPTLNESRWNDLQAHLDKLRCLVLNREEMEMDLERIPRNVPVLLKQGAEGGLCRASGKRWEAEAVEVVDPTGAGDSFIAGVAAGLIQGLSWGECLRQGAGMAARVIREVGARALYAGRGRSTSSTNSNPMWQKQPFQVDLPAGETAALCMCGKTSTPPRCDGSHKGSDTRPKVVKFDKDKTLWVCGCRESGSLPFCDGTHKTIE